MVASVIKILLIEDFRPWHDKILCLLQPNPALQVVCTATNGAEGIERARELQPDIVLLDIALPGIDGIASAREIRRVSSQSKIMFLTENRSRSVMEKALAAGACGYVLKSNALRQLLPAVEAVLAGQQYIGPDLECCLHFSKDSELS
jgi:DNA-binding NarL/FixJ family response regulator